MAAQTLQIARDDGRRPTERRKLTAAWCRDAKPPAKGRRTIYDSEVRNLALVVSATGTRAYYLVRKVNGRARRIRLADGAMALGDVRKLARKTIAQTDAGHDPVAERRARRAKVTTLGELWETYGHERDRRPKTVTAEASLWKHVKSWEGRELPSITPEMLAAKHTRLAKTAGKVTANRVVELVRRVYRFAIKRRLYSGDNPAAYVEFYAESSRDRYVTPAELPALLKAIDAEPEPWPDFFRLLLLTGARKSSLMQMRWRDVDLAGATWSIPREHSKNDERVVVPLVPQAVERLKRRQAEADPGAAFVFPGRYGEAIRNTQAPWERIRKAAGLSDVRQHDLRRTTGSYLAAAGVSERIIGAALGHRSINSTRVYSRLDVEPVRRELDRIAGALSGKGAEDEK